MRKNKRRHKTAKLQEQGVEGRPAIEEPANPFYLCADVLQELLFLAAKTRSLPDCSPNAPPSMERLVGGPNCITNPWGDAERLARSVSISRGIPFVAFHPVLAQARAILNELVQVAAGNSSVPFSIFDLRYAEIENQLRELGETYAGNAPNCPLPEPTKQPMSPDDRLVFDLLRQLPDGEGMTGSEIIGKLKGEKRLDQSVLTARIIPFLKKYYGVKNRLGAGYYVDKNA